jgi:feruloyl esterase
MGKSVSKLLVSIYSGRFLCVLVLAIACKPSVLQARSCESLLRLVSPTVSITLAEMVETGTIAPNRSTESLSHLPPFCRVAVQLSPSADSDIGAEIWLPAFGWSGKFMAVGSGGWGGSIAYDDMADALRRGYATSATDDGHTGHGASFIAGHPEKFADFAYRAEHEMTVEAKRLIKAFYGREARYSYWNGCSGGGREGLLQATGIRMSSMASSLATQPTCAVMHGRSGSRFRLSRILRPSSRPRSTS